jgi:hypothetical protein
VYKTFVTPVSNIDIIADETTQLPIVGKQVGARSFEFVLVVSVDRKDTIDEAVIGGVRCNAHLAHEIDNNCYKTKKQNPVTINFLNLN